MKRNDDQWLYSLFWVFRLSCIAILAILLSFIVKPTYGQTLRIGHCEAVGVPSVYYRGDNLTDHLLCLPRGFADYMAKVMECESSYDAEQVGPMGELGGLQVYLPAHAEDMRSWGLNPDSERDRVWYMAWVIWPAFGWQPWASSQECHGLS